MFVSHNFRIRVGVYSFLARLVQNDWDGEPLIDVDCQFPLFGTKFDYLPCLLSSRFIKNLGTSVTCAISCSGGDTLWRVTCALTRGFGLIFARTVPPPFPTTALSNNTLLKPTDKQSRAASRNLLQRQARFLSVVAKPKIRTWRRMTQRRDKIFTTLYQYPNFISYRGMG